MMPVCVPRTWCGAALASLTICGPIPATAQTLGLAPSQEISAWRVVLALLLCCILGFAGALALRHRLKATGRARIPLFDRQTLARLISTVRFKPQAATGTSPRLQLLETITLSHQVEVSLITCDGATVLMVTSPQGAFVVHPDASPKGTDQP